MFKLTGKAALVAGGAGYLGVPVCRGLAEQGAAVMIADLTSARAEAAAAQVRAAVPGASVRSCAMDVGDPGACRRAVDATVAAFGRLDILVVATFGKAGQTFDGLTADGFDGANRVNISGPFCLARDAAAAMAAGGSIVFYASMYGLVSPEPAMYEPPMQPNAIEYGVGKAAMVQMTRYLAATWGPRGIRVNGIAPGPFPHPQMDGRDDAFVKRLSRKTMLGRIGRQDETAGAVVFLASDEASYVTGQTLAVDGGWTSW